jgi:hypothetical protein
MRMMEASLKFPRTVPHGLICHPQKFVRGGYSGIIPTANNAYIGTADEAAFTGVSDGYVVSIASLGDYVGKNIYIRFRMVSDVTGGSIENGGWWLDDVYILLNRTELVNRATGITSSKDRIMPNEGSNAYSSTSGFIMGSLAIAQNNILSASANEKQVDLKWHSTAAMSEPGIRHRKKSCE